MAVNIALASYSVKRFMQRMRNTRYTERKEAENMHICADDVAKFAESDIQRATAVTLQRRATPAGIGSLQRDLM
jgi:hypothetical protein